jgi:hypothetical protein
MMAGWLAGLMDGWWINDGSMMDEWCMKDGSIMEE